MNDLFIYAPRKPRPLSALAPSALAENQCTLMFRPIRSIQPVVGVFDLGTRAFEGIRNASRMDEDDDADGSIIGQSASGGGSASGGSVGGNRDLQRRRSSSSLETQQQEQQRQRSPGPLSAIQEGSAWESSPTGGGSVGGRGAAGLLSLRARPPRMFGPLGEMDPFTWETSVAQAVLRAGMRDEGDVPSER